MPDNKAKSSLSNKLSSIFLFLFYKKPKENNNKKTDEETVMICENFRDKPSERPVAFLKSLAFIKNLSPSKKFLSLTNYNSSCSIHHHCHT